MGWGGGTLESRTLGQDPKEEVNFDQVLQGWGEPAWRRRRDEESLGLSPCQVLEWGQCLKGYKRRGQQCPWPMGQCLPGMGTGGVSLPLSEAGAGGHWHGRPVLWCLVQYFAPHGCPVNSTGREFGAPHLLIRNNDNNGQHLLSIYYMPGTVLGAFYMSDLI